MRVELFENRTIPSVHATHGAGDNVREPTSVVAPDPSIGHAKLTEPALALMACKWQRDRLVLGDHGTFPKAVERRTANGRGGTQSAQLSGSDRRIAARVAVDLHHSTSSALTIKGENSFTLAYDPAQLDLARSALVAASASDAAGGWPIAADVTSLALLTLAERIAKSDIPVLLEGPTGTGKEVIARFVHRMSERCNNPFVAVNCAAMPEAMLEGLLFGHRKGAFTGAGDAREGLFVAASGGTLLLDEIGELPLALQAKLLRTLQEGEVLPLGATKPVKIDLRVVAATNRTLCEEVAAGRFREDLLYRLNVFPLRLPALRERRGDLAPLAFGMLLRHACTDEGPRWISQDAIDLIENHTWPGNVRELENVIRRAILLAGEAREIGVDHIVFDKTAAIADDDANAEPTSRIVPDGARSLSDVAFQSEAHAIVAALERHNGHRARTARSLNISERTLRYRLASMRENGVAVPGDGARADGMRADTAPGDAA